MLQNKVKQKDLILLSITDQNKQLLQLNKDKNLQERSVLQERVKDLEQRLLDKENEMKLLVRRLQLEAKAFKSNLNMEQQKYRELLMKIEMSDFLLRNEKKSPKPAQKSIIRNKSPANRLNSKSATNLTATAIATTTSSSSNVNGADREHHSLMAAPILPPCDNSKKSEEGIKTNSPCVNSNVKLMPNLKAYDDDDVEEIDLTHNNVDKSNKLLSINKNATKDDNDDLVISVKNGMHRARQQHTNPKANNAKSSSNKKLSPLHLQKQENVKKHEKKSSDESEFSDDDDFHFFSDHNGTKMVMISPVAVKESETIFGLYMSPFSWKYAN
jgi:Ciliary protein causing Leber congenital amaurosis disease